MHKISNIGHCTGGRIDAKGADGVGCGDFSNQNSELLCILGGIIYRFAARFARKNGAFGLPKLKLTAACAHAEMERDRDRAQSDVTNHRDGPASRLVLCNVVNFTLRYDER